jgi:hypothetical protein
MIVFPARRSVGLKAAAASSRVEELSQVLFPVASVCGLRAEDSEQGGAEGKYPVSEGDLR